MTYLRGGFRRVSLNGLDILAFANDDKEGGVAVNADL